jgi:negative regulator of sigma-B (phosphoserine phosphatase)
VADESLVEVGVAGRALPGEFVSGDVHLVAPYPGGVLLAAIDGLGHGSEAAEAARAASASLAEDPAADLSDLLVRTHGRLARTRGAVISLATITEFDSGLTWLGVGNVEGTVVHAEDDARPPTESILLLGGVVGYQLPRLRPSTTTLAVGDLLVMTTDGIRAGYLNGLDVDTAAQELADEILDGFAKGNDDAMVLVARFTGSGG